MDPDPPAKNPPGPPPAPSARCPLRRSSLFLAVLVAALAGSWWFWHRSQRVPRVDEAPSPDPRLTYGGPLENVHPSVQYVGDAACAGCHAAIHGDYRQHPMGRSMAPVARLPSRQGRDVGIHNPFDALGHRFWVDRQGGRVRHHYAAVMDDRPLYQRHMRIDYAIGSGTRGYSYLGVEDGYVFQSPISWFSQKKRWDLSPGFSPELFPGRPVQAGCLQCHVNRVRTRPGEPTRYQGDVFIGHAIGCERCHGPGEKHVALHQGGIEDARRESDSTIVNPAKLPWRLRDAVCEQCHLLGETRVLRRGRDWFDYRPGLPLEGFLSVFVKDTQSPDAEQAVNYVEQIHSSKCYEKSTEANKLGCLSCHDPHKKPAPARRVSFFRERCQKCHETKPCLVPPDQRRARAPGDSCVDCHMPRKSASEIAHTALTDHGIPRDSRFHPARSRPPTKGQGATPPLMHFHHDRLDREDPEFQRDLAIAVARMVVSPKAGTMPSAALSSEALRLLKRSLDRFPRDLDALVACAEVLVLKDQSDEAARCLRRAHDLVPDNAHVMERMAFLTLMRKEYAEAIALFHQLVKIVPQNPVYRLHLANLCVQTSDWAEGRVQSRELLHLDPGNAAGRFLWLKCLAHDGEKAAVAEQMAVLRKLRPDNLAEIERWLIVERRRWGQ